MTRKRYSFEFKKQVVGELERGELTAQALGRKHNVHPISIYQWARKLREGTLQNAPTKRERELEKKLAQAERKVGQLTFDIDLLKKLLADHSRRQKRSGGYRQLLSVASTLQSEPAK